MNFSIIRGDVAFLVLNLKISKVILVIPKPAPPLSGAAATPPDFTGAKGTATEQDYATSTAGHRLLVIVDTKPRLGNWAFAGLLLWWFGTGSTARLHMINTTFYATDLDLATTIAALPWFHEPLR